METMTSDMATRIAALERRVMRNEMKDIAAMPLDALKQVAPLAGPAEQFGDLTQAGIGAVYDAIRSVNEQVGDIAKKLLGGGKSG